VQEAKEIDPGEPLPPPLVEGAEEEEEEYSQEEYSADET
jgi:hypothetical protein